MTARLEAHGISPTPQRLAVAGVLLSGPRHLTADQVHARVNADARKVSVATVYNTLKLFSERGLLREVIVEPGRVFYDSTTGEHHHFYDVTTGELSDIPSGAVYFASLPSVPEGRELAGIDVVIRIRPRH
ncbi:MAG TPA: Fur family transcriptional regulator [Gammaproteobacteria bacterium]